ncbi:MAG TPA: hypothetical protein DIT99_18255 [Candidatus Latescibacteria bacterium]|nr:hypothetical protein [Candidatus Latescibacterota bacterium]
MVYDHQHQLRLLTAASYEAMAIYMTMQGICKISNIRFKNKINDMPYYSVHQYITADQSSMGLYVVRLQLV